MHVDYYIVNIVCNIALFMVMVKLMGDVMDFNEENRNTRIIIFTLCVTITLCANNMFHIAIVNFTTNLVVTFCLACTYSSALIKKIIITIFLCATSAACDLLAYVITHPILNEEHYYYSFIFTVLLMVIIERIAGISLRKGKARNVSCKEVILLMGVPLLAIIILYCVTAMSYGVYQLIASIAIVGITMLSIFLYGDIIKKVEQIWEGRLLTEQVELYRNELEIMQNSDRQIQNLRHDLRHHLVELKCMAQKENNKDIINYVNEMENIFADTKRIVKTGGYEIDSLMNYLIDDAKMHDVEIVTDIAIPEDLDISKCKMNIIVGNLLENAIESAAKAEKRFVSVNLKFKNGNMLIQIKNTYCGKITISNNRIVSSNRKTDRNHGIGLRSVKDLIAQLNGEFEISKIDDEYIVVQALIPIS